MAIQFRCSHCQKPIEVDDEHAGGEALCPFCRQRVPVPDASTLAPAARPVEPTGEAPTVAPGPDVPEPPALHTLPAMPSAEALARQMAARSFARYAIVSALLCYGLFFSVLGYGCVVSVRAFVAISGSGQPPTTQQIEQAQKELMESLQSQPWVQAAQLGATFFALVGTLLAIVSLRQQRTGNWPAVLSLVGCGLYMTCTCGSVAFALAAGVAGT